MDNTKKIIIIVLVAIIAVLGGLVAMGLMKEPVKTVELFENGTTVEVSASTNLTNRTEFSTEYVTAKNTTIMALDDNNLVGALASKILSEIIVDAGEMQDNGLYKLDKNSIKEIGDELGWDYDEKNLKDVFVGIKHNNTVNQSVFVIGADEQEMVDILASIHWKLGVQHNVTAAQVESSSSDTSSADKTYPFYADDGSIVGYYHVGDVVTHYDGLYQLKSNGEWVYIGEAEGTSDMAYDQGYSDGVDDASSDYDDYDYDYEYDDEETDDEK